MTNLDVNSYSLATAP